MKKTLRLTTLILLTACLTQAGFCATSSKLNANIQSKRIDEGSVFELKMADTLMTSQSKTGDNFSSYLITDKKSGSKIILPAGSIVRGEVSNVKPAKRLSKDGALYLHFDHVVTTSGRQVPLKAGLYGMNNLTLDGGISEGGNYWTAVKTNGKQAGQLIKKSTKWGIDNGREFWGGAGMVVLVPIGAIGGTLGGGIFLVGDTVADLFRKGKDVNLNQGSVVKIMLTEPVDIPVS